MAVSDRPWSEISEADYPDAGAFCDASLINLNTGPRSEWTKDLCKLPVREPGGALNRNAVHAAAGGHGIGAVQAPAAVRRAAARQLVRLYGQLDEEAPDAVRRLAGQ